MTEDQKQLFETHLRELLDQAIDVTGYPFSGVLEIIDQHGAVEAAKLLIGPNSTGKFHDGFKVLIAEQLPHLSVEQAVIDFKDSGLFSPDDVSSAKSRLIMAEALLNKK